MKNLAALVIIIVCTLSMSVQAGQKQNQGAKKNAQAKTALLESYDSNKNGKIDKKERHQMSRKDKKQARKMGLAKNNSKKSKSK